MTSRTDILARVRQHHIPDSPLPVPGHDWIRFADPLSQFRAVLQSVGGQSLVSNDRQHLVSLVSQLEFTRAARKIVCTVVDLAIGNCDLNDVEDPHALADLDVAIVPGEFAVAENGAVWVSDLGLRHRAVLFLAEHLVLVVPPAAIVHQMHEAYERLTFDAASYGVFMSGPSKTADIEQSLVIGAHGPRSLTVVFAPAQAIPAPQPGLRGLSPSHPT